MSYTWILHLDFRTNRPYSAPYFGSKSASPLLGIGGYQGRSLAPGDMLAIAKFDAIEAGPEISLPSHLRPVYSRHWDIYAMVGPYDEGYIVPEDIDMIYDTVWYVVPAVKVGGLSRCTSNSFIPGMFRIMLQEVVFALSDLLLDGQGTMEVRVDNTLVT